MPEDDNWGREPTDEDVAHLREWLKKMPHLVQDYDDEFLKGFMRSCKGSLQRTKLIFENWNGLGHKCPDIFGNLDPAQPGLQKALDQSFCFPLPKKTEDGSMVVIFGLNPNYKGDPTDLNILEAYKYWFMMVHIYLWENNYQDGKMITIYDCRHVRIGHVKDYTPMAIKNLVEAKQHAIPMRLMAVHHLYAPSILEWVLSTFRFVDKILKRIHYHSTMEAFYEHFPQREILPKDYGGDEDSIEVLHERWRKKVLSYRHQYIEDDKKKRSLDHLRPKSDNSQEMTGTFRKLTID